MKKISLISDLMKLVIKIISLQLPFIALKRHKKKKLKKKLKESNLKPQGQPKI